MNSRPSPPTLHRPSFLARQHRARQTLAVAGWNLAPVALKAGASRKVDTTALARSLRSTFRTLGATYVKLGQVAASMPDVFGREIADEFRSLLDAGQAVPFARIKSVVEAETGAPLEDTFASFDTTPVGRASIAVVHRATLHDGTEVAVKVVRPGARRTVAADLAVMRQVLPPIVARAGGHPEFVRPMLTGLREQLDAELDLRNEAAAMVEFAQLLDVVDLPLVTVPDVHHELSGQRVLVMQYLDGVPVDDLAGVEAFGYDPVPVIDEVMRAWFMMAIRWGVFHGDAHAGNLLLLRDGRIGILDWGIVGRLAPDTHHHLRRVIAAALGDESAWQDVADAIIERAGPLLESEMGLTPEQVPAFVKATVEPLLTMPFGQVSLAGLLLGQVGEAGQTGPFSRRPSDGGDLPDGFEIDFDRDAFLLGKQLLYFERYGRLYLKDRAILSDRAFFEKLLAECEPIDLTPPDAAEPADVDPPA